MTVGELPVKKGAFSLDRVLVLRAKSDLSVRVRQLMLRNVHMRYTNVDMTSHRQIIFASFSITTKFSTFEISREKETTASPAFYKV